MNVLKLISNYFYPKKEALAVDPNAILRKEIFSNGPPLPEISSALSGNTMGTAWMVSDYTSIYRATQDLAVGIWNTFPSAPLSWMNHFSSSKDIALGYHAFGSATAINAIIGIVRMKSAFRAMQRAEALEDGRAKLMGRLSLAQSGTIFGAGVSFAAFRPLSMVGIIGNHTPNCLIGRLSYGFLAAGLSCYALFFSLLSAALGIKVYEGIKLQNKLKKANSVEEQIEILRKKITVDPSKISADPEILRKEALEAGIAGLEKIVEELGLDQVDHDRLEKIITDLFDEKSLTTIGLQMRVQKKGIKKLEKMQRVLGRTGFNALQHLDDPESLERIKKSISSKVKENGVVLAICALGVIPMITAIVCTGGIPLIVSSVLMLGFSLLMMGVDGYYLLQSYRNEAPAPYDKKMLILSTVLAVLSFSSLVILGATGVVTMGLFPLVVGLVLSALWLGQNGVSWYILNRKASLKKIEEVKESNLELLREALTPHLVKEVIS